MIADMEMPAVLVGMLVALPYLLSPLQVFVGNWTDRHPVWGLHRSPWILAGGILATFGSYLAAHAAYLLDEHFWPGLLASAAIFTLWGVGVNVASVSYLSLASELTENERKSWRTATVGTMWTAMILSTIVASIVLSRALAIDASVAGVYTAFGAVWLVATALILVGSAGIEGAAEPARAVRSTADNPVAALRRLSGNATAKRFFAYLLLVLIGIRAQDVLLEPFAADALDLSVSATTRLEAIWGVGVFITLLGGLALIYRFGKRANANAGAVVAIVAFAGIIAAGALHNAPFFYAAVFLLGLGSGLMTVSNLSFMLDMTIPQSVGLYMGAWGVANFLAQSLGTIGGALFRDVAYLLTGDAVLGYMTVFGIEIVGLVVSILLFRTISIEQFQHEAEVELVDVLALAGD